LRAIRQAAGVPLRVVRLVVSYREIERRLASDVTSGRRDDLRAAATSITTAQGAGLEDTTITNDQPVTTVAHQVMTLRRLDHQPGRPASQLTKHHDSPSRRG
jgi:hypothetical protein